MCRDRVLDAQNLRCGQRVQDRRAGVVRVLLLRNRRDRPGRVGDTLVPAVVEREDVVLLRLASQSAINSSTSRGSCGEVVGLREVHVRVVKLPLVVFPRRILLVPGHCRPAIGPDRPASEHFVVLRLLAGLGVASVNVFARLTPCSGICLTPFTEVGAGSPVTSRMVGTTSMMWWYWLRIAPPSLIFAGHETMKGRCCRPRGCPASTASGASCRPSPSPSGNAGPWTSRRPRRAS